jgi:uncharacterized protein (DUF1499 family)
MKLALIILASIFAVFVIWFFILGIISRAGKAPGLAQGALSICPDTPNCVCSEYKDDVNHYIDPIIIPPNITLETLPTLEDIIRGMGGTIQSESNNYIAATFSSRIFRFVDDFEIRIDPTLKVIHIRSASRVGKGDMGVNRKRTELFKELFNKKVSEVK